MALSPASKSGSSRPTWMYAVAAIVACAGVGLAVWTLIPEKRPEPRRPGTFTRGNPGGSGDGSPSAGNADTGGLPTPSDGSGEVRRVVRGGPGDHGPPPVTIAEAKNPPDLKPVKADDSWPSVMDQLASAIEVAAKELPNLSDTPTKTAYDLGQAGARAILSALTSDNPRALDAIKDLGGDTTLMLPSGPPMGPVAAAFSDGSIDIANVTVVKPPATMRSRPPVIPPEDGSPRKRAMMISMSKQNGPEGEVSTMTVDEGGLFPSVADYSKDKLPAWEIRVPLKVIFDGVEAAKPPIISVIMAKDAKSGQWRPASWNYILRDSQVASSVMKSVMTQASKMRAAAAEKEKK